MKVLREFKEFAMQGNVIDMAVGIALAGAFGKIATSLVNDILMPPIGFLLGNMDFANFFIVLREGKDVAGPHASLADAQAAGAVTINYGVFVNTIVSFVLIALAMFLLVRSVNRLRRQKKGEPTTRECPYCLSSIPIQATRCPHCTSELEAAQEKAS